jgi:hypothetical protein
LVEAQTRENPFQPGIRALKQNWLPIIVLQALAAALVFSYYHSTRLHAWTGAIQSLKERQGLWFAVYAGAIAGGLLPQAAKWVTGKENLNRTFWSTMAFHGCVFAFLGIEVDLFYRFQTELFGGSIDVLTLVKKDAFDMFIFSPLISMPTIMAPFALRGGYAVRHLFSREFYREKIVTGLLPCWAFWIPMLMCVYALPSSLQFPFAQIAEACWSLVICFIATE